MKAGVKLILLAILLLLGAGFSLSLGAGGWDLLLTGLSQPDGQDSASLIIWRLRLPRLLLALAGGASLALAGAALQAILMNPLADPFLLGVS